jgi:chromosome segregation and condensation protein ScpB
MGMNKANVGKAMKRLVELGYIREGLRQENGGRSYMLVAVRGEPSKRSA